VKLTGSRRDAADDLKLGERAYTLDFDEWSSCSREEPKEDVRRRLMAGSGAAGGSGRKYCPMDRAHSRLAGSGSGDSRGLGYCSRFSPCLSFMVYFVNRRGAATARGNARGAGIKAARSSSWRAKSASGSPGKRQNDPRQTGVRRASWTTSGPPPLGSEITSSSRPSCRARCGSGKQALAKLRRPGTLRDKGDGSEGHERIEHGEYSGTVAAGRSAV